MKKILSLTLFTAAFFSFSFVVKAQVHYSYTYYDYSYELPAYVVTVVHDQYRSSQMVRARSYYHDNNIAYNLVFSRGNNYIEVFVDHRGYITKRITYAHNPVTHVWVRPYPQPHHQHYYVKGNHHDGHHKKYNHKGNNAHYKSPKNNKPAQTYERRDNSRSSQPDNVRLASHRSETSRYHSNARR